MKTRAWIAAVSLWAACSPAPPPLAPGGVRPAKTEAEKARIRRFWDTFRQAQTAEKERRCADAVPGYEAALALDPRHQDSHYGLGACLAELGRFEEALASLDRLVEVSPDHSPRGHGLAADILSRLEPGAPIDLARARRYLERHNQLNPEESGPLLALGELELVAGDRIAARRYLEKALGLNHTSARGTYHLALLDLLAGDRERAAANLALAIERGRPKGPHKGVKQEGDTAEAPPPLTGWALAADRAREWVDAPASWPGTEEIALPAGAVPVALAAADFDGDGDVDLAVADEARGVRLLRADGGRLGDATGALGLDASAPATGVAWGDVDGDGRLDLYVAGPNGGALHRRSASGFVAADVGLAGARSIARAALADLDRDGDLDLVECGGAPDPVRTFLQDGGRFARTAAIAGLPPVRPCTSLALADADGDGAPEVVATFWKESPRLLRNDGRGGLADATVEAGLEQPALAGIASLFSDLDGDGHADLLFAPARSLEPTTGPPAPAPLRLFLGRGDGKFAPAHERVAGLGMTTATAVVWLGGATGTAGEVLVAGGGPRFDARTRSLRLVPGPTWTARVWPEPPAPPLNVNAAVALGGGRVAILAGGRWPAGLARLLVVRLDAALQARSARR